MTIEEQEVLRQMVPERKHIDYFFLWDRGGFDMRLVERWIKDPCAEIWNIYSRQAQIAMLTRAEFEEFRKRFSELLSAYAWTF